MKENIFPFGNYLSPFYLSLEYSISMEIIKKVFPIVILFLTAACNFPGSKTTVITPPMTAETVIVPSPSETAAPSATSTPGEL
jgi:hypothetical protein